MIKNEPKDLNGFILSSVIITVLKWNSLDSVYFPLLLEDFYSCSFFEFS